TTPQGRHSLANSTNKTIGINKHGTLLSSQTTDTFEYFRNNLEFVSHFFAAMFQAYFIHIHFCKSGVFPEFTRWE
ncbi:hypothetical protein, partial [Arthrobacter sp. AD-310]